MLLQGRLTLLAIYFVATLIGTPPHAPTPAAATEALVEPHDFDRTGRPCKYCHASIGVKKRGSMRKTVGAICAECHTLNPRKHSVEIDPAMEIPADLPLDSEGLLTCATCHNIHRSRFNPLTGEKTMYLRRDGPPRAFCESCHRNGIFTAGEAISRR